MTMFSLLRIESLLLNRIYLFIFLLKILVFYTEIENPVLKERLKTHYIYTFAER